ncbi:MAG: protease inhibitor I42 family protein [Dehalococcoidales bacterium]|nr:protease inhibitor I42 family protein [Dehalococcoidales bacterium]
MKRVLLLVTLVVLTLGLVAGCVGVKTYKNVGEDIKIGVGQEFIIALGSNPTTGYSWQASYDESMLELVGGEPTYEAEETGDDVVGAGGIESFQFRALEVGETEITLTYAQPWEGGGVDETKVFTVVIE